MSTIFITGTRKGIGRALAKHFLKQGHDVIGCSRGDSAIHAAHYQHFTLDITNESDVVTTLRAIKKSYPQLDVLINNAGIASMNSFTLTPGRTVQSIFNTNVFGCFYCLREAAKLMIRKKRGRIINFSTVATAYNLEGEAIYAASKAAVESLTRTTARELADYNITVNAIAPTPIHTDLIKTVPKDKIDALVQRQAIKRLGNMDDIINVVDFFIKPESNFITGQTLYLGGVHG